MEQTISNRFGYEILSLKDMYRIGSEGHFDATCQETVPMAIRCFLDADNFEDVIRKAIRADGDTDTKAAIACSLAEAYFEIPDEILDNALKYLPKEMIDLLDEFYDAIEMPFSK